MDVPKGFEDILKQLFFVVYHYNIIKKLVLLSTATLLQPVFLLSNESVKKIVVNLQHLKIVCFFMVVGSFIVVAGMLCKVFINTSIFQRRK